MIKSEKKHDTGLRILEILKILLESDASKKDIMSRLERNPAVDAVYTQEAFLKYFNTYEILGLKIRNIKGRYTLANALIKAELTKKEENAIKNIIHSIGELKNRKPEDTAKEVMLRLNKYLEIDTEEIIKRTEEENRKLLSGNIRENMIITLKRLMKENQKAAITYINANNKERVITALIKEIKEENKNTYVICCKNMFGRARKININSIILIKHPIKKSKSDVEVRRNPVRKISALIQTESE